MLLARAMPHQPAGAATVPPPPQAAQGERRPQLGRGGDVAAPLVEGDADLEPVVTHWYLAHRAKDRRRVGLWCRM